ncbi:MAG TPA: hypothetical protein VMV70_06200 [Gallionella sp.]|nr:hypothetical protein [Gallionella sp.]
MAIEAMAVARTVSRLTSYQVQFLIQNGVFHETIKRAWVVCTTKILIVNSRNGLNSKQMVPIETVAEQIQSGDQGIRGLQDQQGNYQSHDWGAVAPD